MNKRSLFSRLLTIVLSLLVMIQLIPGVINDITAESSSNNDDEEIVIDEYTDFLDPDAPSTYEKDSGENNPYGYDTGDVFALSESMSLLSLRSSGGEYSLSYGYNFKLDGTAVSDKNGKAIDQDAATGVAKVSEDSKYYYSTSVASAYLNKSNNTSYEETKTLSTDVKNTMSFMQGVAWDPYGEGSNTHAAYIGVRKVDSKYYLSVYDVDTASGNISNILNIKQLNFFTSDDKIQQYYANNFFSITAGDYNGNHKQGLVVFSTDKGDDYGLFYIEYESSDPNVSRTLVLRNTSPSKVLTSQAYANAEDKIKNDSSNWYRICGDLATGDFNSDGIDDLAVITYTQDITTYGYDIALYEPYLAVSYGSDNNSAANNPELILSTRDVGTIVEYSSEEVSSDKFLHTTPLCPSIAVGRPSGDNVDKIVVGGYTQVISSEDNSKCAKSHYNGGLDGDNYILITYDAQNGSLGKEAQGQLAATKAMIDGFKTNNQKNFQQSAVACANINGGNNSDYIFINGSLYEQSGSEYILVYAPK